MLLIPLCAIGMLLVGRFIYDVFHYSKIRYEVGLISVTLLVSGAILGILATLLLSMNLEFIEVETYSANLLPLPNSEVYVEVYLNSDKTGLAVYLIEGESDFRSRYLTSYDTYSVTHTVGQHPTVKIYTSKPKDPWYWLYALPHFSGRTVLSAPEGGIRFHSIEIQTDELQ